ncbi:protein of unknown function [Paenibacillus sp. cl141a]|uniref:DUF4179 domain-containing protein n=1 Tax=Paenibacillus sp. cl141a TaxID=1761877 RepID=UPI0008D6A83B|nr:DUF4179 domain-containing protein [Paenibacillus sp. cl141a]SEL52377.1 protein of unknown function [Paenibacillus sp. cl141a]
MNKRDLEQQLRELGSKDAGKVPDIIRRRQEEVYAALETFPMQERSHRKKADCVVSRVRRILLTAAAVLIVTIGGLLGGAAVSPTIAAALQSVPLIGSLFKLAADDLGLQTLEERGLVDVVEASATHDGITLRIPELVYDGTRLSMVVTRDGEKLSGSILDQISTGNGTKPKYPKGAIHSFEAQIDGRPISRQNNGWNMGFKAKPTSDPNTAIYELTSHSVTKQLTSELPDAFTLTIQVGLEGVEEQFMLELPVRKHQAKVMSTIQKSREWRGHKLTLSEIQFTPITTQVLLSVVSDDQEWQRRLWFELWDDSGNVLGVIGGYGAHETGRAGELRYNVLFERMAKAPSSIKLKAFLPEMEHSSSSSGSFKLNERGEVIKNYINELEITVPVDQAEIQKLYEISSETRGDDKP